MGIQNFMYKTYDEALKHRKDFKCLDFIFTYIQEKEIEEEKYKRAIFRICFDFEQMDRQFLLQVLPHYKYMANYYDVMYKRYLSITSLKGFNEDAYTLFIGELEEAEAKQKAIQAAAFNKLVLTGYSNFFTAYIKDIMVDDFIDIDTVSKAIPDSSLIDADERKVCMINYLYGIKNAPISHILTYKKCLGEDLNAHEMFYKTYEGDVTPTFTLDDFTKEKAIKK